MQGRTGQDRAESTRKCPRTSRDHSTHTLPCALTNPGHFYKQAKATGPKEFQPCSRTRHPNWPSLTVAPTRPCSAATWDKGLHHSPSAALPVRGYLHGTCQKAAPSATSGCLPRGTCKLPSGDRQGSHRDQVSTPNLEGVLGADVTALANSLGGSLWPGSRVNKAPHCVSLSTGFTCCHVGP